MKLLVGYGGTDDAAVALRKTIERAAEADDELTVALVDDPAAEDADESLESAVREALDGAGMDATIEHLDGDPGAKLVEMAETGGFDGIVLGGGEKSPMGKIRIGSLQEFVLLNAHTTVTLVR
ncbi:MAG: universal stress protein [Salinigranum sp.]